MKKSINDKFYEGERLLFATNEIHMEKNKQATGSNTQDRRALSRRDFLANTALIGAGLAVGPLSWAASSDQPKEINKNENTKTRKIRSLGNRSWVHEYQRQLRTPRRQKPRH